MTKEEKLIVSAYTGFLMCDWNDLHKFIEDTLGRPVWTHELADNKLEEEIRLRLKPRFLAICAARGESSQPRWIPVTERLPDAEYGDVSERVLVTDGKDVAIVEWFSFEECAPFWGYTGFGKDVTHWMPLPEPPKEGQA